MGGGGGSGSDGQLNRAITAAASNTINNFFIVFLLKILCMPRTKALFLYRSLRIILITGSKNSNAVFQYTTLFSGVKKNFRKIITKTLC